MKTKLKLLPVESLQRGIYQPRQDFDESSLQELAHSIETQGLIEPLVVRQLESGSYEIIAGERRWRAALLAGLSELPCLVGEYSDEQAAAVTLIENIQRENLNLIEEATGYQRLISEFCFSQEEVASLVGKSRSHIANMMRLLTLCPFVQECLRKRSLSLGHARMLVGLSASQQQGLAKEIQEQGLSVRRLEERVRALKNEIDETCFHESPDIIFLETQLAEQVGTPVQIATEKNQGGWLKIKFYDNDTLTGLLERLGLRYD